MPPGSMKNSTLPPIIVLVGPTAVGKTEVAIQLSKKFGGEIISIDSRTFYRGMDIGTAKPTIEQRQQVPHHLIDIVPPDETISLGTVQKLALEIISEVHLRGHLPFLVGGSGQYVRAVVQGWKIPEVKPHTMLRQALEKWSREIGKDELHRRLASLDAQAAQLIDPRNLRRTIRALEVIFLTGRRFSEQRQRVPLPFRVCMIGLVRPRQELYRRIDQRIVNMLSAGWITEVQALLDKGYSPELPAFSAIGYRQLARVVRGELNIEDAVSAIMKRSRILVRRQHNWFKPDDPDIHWFDLSSQRIEDIESFIHSWLEGR